MSYELLQADQAGKKSVKIGEDSWIKVLILMHLFCSEALSQRSLRLR